MKIALIGYGKMGLAIEDLVKDSEDEIILKIQHPDELFKLNELRPDVAIEFTNPQSAFKNISYCLENEIPCVSGTTGWLDKYDEVVQLCEEKNGAFFYASNFSLGVNLFFHFNEFVAKTMSQYTDYVVIVEETHHIHKKDAPSGTAISIAEKIMKSYSDFDGWALNEKKTKKINIIAHRKENVPGTHVVRYSSEIDDIELTHIAKGRKGFAKGALLAAKWLFRKKGVFGMNDMMNLE